tara:strand:+ start:635 stop:838 length:204 start_codon:yes stop_codon:yes gene_type:complete
MEKKKENFITINDKKYDVEKLSDKAKFCINGLNNNQQKKSTLEIELNNVNICIDYYTKELNKELEDN